MRIVVATCERAETERQLVRDSAAGCVWRAACDGRGCLRGRQRRDAYGGLHRRVVL